MSRGWDRLAVVLGKVRLGCPGDGLLCGSLTDGHRGREPQVDGVVKVLHHVASQVGVFPFGAIVRDTLLHDAGVLHVAKAAFSQLPAAAALKGHVGAGL